jgi:threonine dehydrogenase-like Zn-dependent dehydrogenase
MQRYDDEAGPAQASPAPKFAATMQAIEWHGNKRVHVAERPRPVIGEVHDAVIRVTSTTICGSDLHIYHHAVPGMHHGDVLGHECMGVVEEVGSQVQSLRPGDRVVVSSVIAEGHCQYCREGLYGLCEVTSPVEGEHKLYGHCTAGMVGYSHLTGRYDGGQASHIRVPYADTNCLVVPADLSDEQVLFLSDIACTGWHANELGDVRCGQTVAVWGCGPVGLMAMAWARYRGAERIIAIDRIPYRLEAARQHLGAEILNFEEDEVPQALRDLTHGRGPHVAIEAVGFRYPKTLLNKIEQTLGIESDPADPPGEILRSVRKGGTVAIVGDFFDHVHHLPIGVMMQKGLTVRTGQVHVQRYWRELLEIIARGDFDPSFVISHRMPLSEAVEAYRMFDEKSDHALKIVLRA